MSPRPGTRLQVPSDVAFRELEGESVVLDLRTGTYFGLNASGTRIWQLIEQYGTIDRVFDEMVKEFEVERDAVVRDVRTLVDQLLARGLLRAVDE